MNRKAAIILVTLLAAVVLAVVFDFSCSADAQEVVRVEPTTQPIRTPDGQIVIPPPTVTVQGDHWTPGNTVAVLAFVAAVLIPTVVSAWLAVWGAMRQSKVEARQQEQEKRLDRQGEAQTKMARDMPAAAADRPAE